MNEVVVKFPFFALPPPPSHAFHQAALFSLNHKINKVLLEDLFQKIAFGAAWISSKLDDSEQVDEESVALGLQ